MQGTFRSSLNPDLRMAMTILVSLLWTAMVLIVVVADDDDDDGILFDNVDDDDDILTASNCDADIFKE